MVWWSGLFAAAAILLVASGATKLAAARPTREALRAARLPAPPGVGWTIGLAEVALGTLATLTGTRAAAVAVAGAYAAFAGFVVVARARGGRRASCGCFGATGAPPSLGHLAATAALAAVAGLQAARPGAGMATLVAASPLHALIVLGYAALVAWLVYLVLAALPGVRAASSRG